MTEHILRGGCHCGSLEIEMHTELPTERLPVRTCQCSFCRQHGTVSTSDPAGRVVFRVRDAQALSSYRFGLKLADFLICRRCGVNLGAFMPDAGGLAVVNVNALAERARFAAPQPMSYEGESVEQRLARRRQRWMPARIEVPG